MTDQALIYTNIGNVAEDSLDLVVEWEDNVTVDVQLRQDAEGKFTPVMQKTGTMAVAICYYDKETKELRKRSVHVKSYSPLPITSEQANLS